MPLHLLSKKSWNVYNPAAIARVRADEEAAAARERAHEQSLQEYEAAKRLALLRGQTSPDPPLPLDHPVESEKRRRDDEKHCGGPKKRRKLIGEDDTDRDIRFAREAEVERKQHRDTRLAPTKDENSRIAERDLPLVDHAGHIQLFAPPSIREIKAAENVEADAQRKRKENETGNRTAMGFSKAAAFRNGPKGVPWYAKRVENSTDNGQYTGTDDFEACGRDIAGKDAFGNEDPGRAKRDTARMSAADPMATMMKAQKKLKEVERERKTKNREREKDLKELAELQRRQAASETGRIDTRGRHDRDEDELEEFSLDADPPSERQGSSKRYRPQRSFHGSEGSNQQHRRRSRDRHIHRTHRKRKLLDIY